MIKIYTKTFSAEDINRLGYVVVSAPSVYIQTSVHYKALMEYKRITHFIGTETTGFRYILFKDMADATAFRLMVDYSVYPVNLLPDGGIPFQIVERD